MLYNMEYKIINIALIEYFNKSIRASNYLKEKTVLNNIMVQHRPTWRSGGNLTHHLRSIYKKLEKFMEKT